MLRGGVDRVYWVGMPIMPSQSESKKMRDLNELFENVAASSPDIVYVDSYELLARRTATSKPHSAAATACTTPRGRDGGRRGGLEGDQGRLGRSLIHGRVRCV